MVSFDDFAFLTECQSMSHVGEDERCEGDERMFEEDTFKGVNGFTRSRSNSILKLKIENVYIC